MLSGRGLYDELITRPEESYRLCCVVVCDLETSRRGAPYIYDISRLRVNSVVCTAAINSVVCTAAINSVVCTAAINSVECTAAINSVVCTAAINSVVCTAAIQCILLH